MKASFWFLIPSLLLGLVGCASDSLRPVPIADGKFVGIQFGPNGPVNGKADGYEVHAAGLMPGTDDKQVIYVFGLSVPDGVKLKRVRVDDISDEQNSSLVDDTQPWVEANRWISRTAPRKPDDPMLKWVYTVTNSLRVYRFIVTDSNGHQSVLYQVGAYPDFRKAAIRNKLGEKY